MGSQILDGKIIHDDMTRNASGGTELLASRLVNNVDRELFNDVQIHLSRQSEVDDTKAQILWCHDLPNDPAVNHLANEGWKKYGRIVFVSHWQRQVFHDKFGIPWDHSNVIQNMILPIGAHEKPDDKIRLMYHSTPHRGLNILYAAFKELAKKYGDDIELNVFSSFDLYGWGERDEPYSDLFKALEDHPQINYSKSVPNSVIREELKRNHIHAYPSIWQETSCLSLIEAMSANMVCVHSSLGALPETAKGLTTMYDYIGDLNAHAGLFHMLLDKIIANKGHIQPNNVTPYVIDHNHSIERIAEIWANYLKVFNK